MATGMVCDNNKQEPLAIVGIGCRLPGDVSSVEELWTLLCEATDATREVPETRWHAARFHDPSGSKIGKMVTRRGGFLAEIDQFDPQFFGISPREAHSLDPQQRLLLEVTWQAFEDGGTPVDGLAGSDVGVFVGGGDAHEPLDGQPVDIAAAGEEGIDLAGHHAALLRFLSGIHLHEEPG